MRPLAARTRCLVFLLLGLVIPVGQALPPLAAEEPDPATQEAENSTAANPRAELVARALEREVLNDEQIASQVAAKLARHEVLGDVTVQVSGGTAILAGTVVNETQRQLAEALTATVTAVVDNHIEIHATLGQRLVPAWRQIQDSLIQLTVAAPLLLVAGAIVALFAWLGGLLAARLHLVRRTGNNPYLHSLIQRGVRLAMVAVGLLIALDLLGATTLVGAVLGSAGVLGIMLGFAFRDVAENHLAGVLLSLRRPFEPGDFIAIDGHEGKVMSLNSRATVLMTLDGNHLRLPNALVFKGVMLNYTRNPLRRLRFTLGVAADEDLSAVRQLGVETLGAMQAILASPEPQATILSVGDSSVVIEFSAWIDQRKVDFTKTRSEAIRLVKCALERAGMDMPEPTYRVQLLDAAPPLQESTSQESTLLESTSQESTLQKRQLQERPLTPETRAQPGATQPLQQSADVSVNNDVDRQIALERATDPGEDLLQQPAPRE